MEHYRCDTVYINKTQDKRIADAADFPPEHKKTPVISNQEAATNMELDTIEAISNPYPTALFLSTRASKLQSIKKLAYMFK